MDRSEWLAARRKGIGASDAAAVAGMSPWGSPLSVYLDKLGLLPEKDTPPMRWGLKLEETIACAWEEETGQQLVLPALQVMQHPRHPWMLASLDRLGPDGPVELKTSRSMDGWGLPGTDEVPEHYLLQVQHQMAVCGADTADVACLIGGSDFRRYTVRRHQGLIDTLIQMEERFWDFVVHRKAPAVDWKDPDAPRLVELLYRPDPEEVIDLPGIDPQILTQRYQDLGAQMSLDESAREAIKAQLVTMMGCASIARLDNGREIVRSTVQRKEHVVKASEYTTFRIRKQKARAS